MRLFDVIGAVAVVAWCALVGSFVDQEYFAANAAGVDSSVVFKEGSSWMLLTREEQEVGYIHEARTPVDSGGWLLEYDILFNVSMLGVDQFLRTEIKASVDPDARLEQFSAEIITGATSFSLTGEVQGKTVVMKMDLAGEMREQKLTLTEAPRLANSALNQLVAQGDKLTPGARFEQEYFDPTVMGMTKMVFEFVRPHEVAVYEETVSTYHFRQIVSGTELDVYVDKNGEVYIQEFPLRIVGSRMPPELGRARAQSLRREFETSQKSGGVDLSVETAVGLFKGTEGIGALTPKSPSKYAITNIPEDVVLELSSGEQAVIEKSQTSATVDTSMKGDSPTLSDEQLEPYLQSSLRIDGDAEVFDDLVASELPDSLTLRAEKIGRAVKSRMTTSGEVGIQTASQALEKGSGDCTEYSLVLVAALRRHGVPARFVSGVKRDEKKNFIPHQWVQYWTGSGFVDIDATTDTLLPGLAQVQLFTHAQPEHPAFVHILDQINIEPLDLEAPADRTGEGADGDFN